MTGLAGRLVAALRTETAGFTRALRDRTLDDQEQLRAAATIARSLAEQALRDSEARQRYAAMHDPLTGLPNQTSLMERLQRLVTDPAPAPPTSPTYTTCRSTG